MATVREGWLAKAFFQWEGKYPQYWNWTEGFLGVGTSLCELPIQTAPE